MLKQIFFVLLIWIACFVGCDDTANKSQILPIPVGGGGTSITLTTYGFSSCDTCPIQDDIITTDNVTMIAGYSLYFVADKPIDVANSVVYVRRIDKVGESWPYYMQGNFYPLTVTAISPTKIKVSFADAIGDYLAISATIVGTNGAIKVIRPTVVYIFE